jgi:lysosomal Pro-X carboxypeptidase
MAFAIQNYYNSSGDRTCVNMERDQPDFALSPGWGYIACTEAYFPMAQRGIWIPHTEPNLAGDEAACKAEWGINMRPNWSRIHWGGFKSFSVASNIIFSNGLIDPWHALGQLTSPSKDSVAILIPTGGHHADLRAPDPADTIYITNARKQEEEVILGWLKNFFA